jgi:pyruvate ferredoxin oxidoreductase delta subunit
MLCYFYCPDASIIVENGKAVGIDLLHCKGCGICAKECPASAIAMKSEEKE